jgi:hypothetical protein
MSSVRIEPLNVTVCDGIIKCQCIFFYIITELSWPALYPICSKRSAPCRANLRPRHPRPWLYGRKSANRSSIATRFPAISNRPYPLAGYEPTGEVPVARSANFGAARGQDFYPVLDISLPNVRNGSNLALASPCVALPLLSGGNRTFRSWSNRRR